MVLVQDDGDVRPRLDRRFDHVAQESFAGIFAGSGGGLKDDRAVALVGGQHDRADLFHIVDVEGRQAVAMFGGVVQQLAHRNEGHGFLRCIYRCSDQGVRGFGDTLRRQVEEAVESVGGGRFAEAVDTDHAAVQSHIFHQPSVRPASMASLGASVPNTVLR